MSRFNPPANWPVPKNFTPGPDWRPDPAWGPAPMGWQLWVHEAPKKSWFARHKILTGLGGLILVIAMFNGLNGGSHESADPALADAPVEAAQPAAAQPDAAQPVAPKKEAPKKEEPKITPVGAAVTDGDFEFVVSKSSCGKTQIGSEYSNKQAQGQFCEVKIEAKNVGKQPVSFNYSDANLFNASGQQFAADSEAMIYDSQNTVWFEQVNPGNKLQGTLVFDVPAEVTPTHINLKGSLFSSGADLALS